MAASIASTNAAVIFATPPGSIAPFTALRSTASFPVTARNGKADITNGGRVQCMKVWPTEGKKKFETLSYLPPLTRKQLTKQIEYLIRLDLIPCLEFTLGEAFPYRENNRSPTYYDGRYWTMWKLPMFGCEYPHQVVRELDEAINTYPKACVKIIGFDPQKQVQVISFIGHKRHGLD